MDLDETLIHSENIPPPNKSQVKAFKIWWKNSTTDQNETAYTCLRPGVFEFLQTVNDIFEVVLFTASMPNYAKQIVKLIDRKGYNFPLLTRNQCTLTSSKYLKDLSILGRDLKSVIIVDNFPESYSKHPRNGLPIESWYDNPSDKQLKRMLIGKF